MAHTQTAADFIAALQVYASPEDGEFLGRFFKTGKGQYGEGDTFIGVRVPQTRAVCRQFIGLPLAEVQKLLDSPVHEHRLGAVILLANQYAKAKASPDGQRRIFSLYLKNVRAGRVNNWDLVDSSAAYIVGPWLADKPKELLFELAESSSLWCRRVAIMSAFAYVKKGDHALTLELAEKLLHDREDLIHKAVGWQLREVGKHGGRDLLLAFLDKHAATMPRTMLRYAIEHLTPQQKAHYMGLRKSTPQP